MHFFCLISDPLRNLTVSTRRTVPIKPRLLFSTFKASVVLYFVIFCNCNCRKVGGWLPLNVALCITYLMCTMCFGTRSWNTVSNWLLNKHISTTIYYITGVRIFPWLTPKATSKRCYFILINICTHWSHFVRQCNSNFCYLFICVSIYIVYSVEI